MAASSTLQTPIEEIMKNIGQRVACGIEIQNLTTHALVNPAVTVSHGRIHTPPGIVLPEKQGHMVACKTLGAACGSSGVVSWEVEGLDMRIVVMWSAPFDFNFFPNSMAVGITSSGHTMHGQNWYKDMNKGLGVEKMTYDRKEFKASMSAVRQENDRISITGTMGSRHQTPVKVTVREMPKKQ